MEGVEGHSNFSVHFFYTHGIVLGLSSCGKRAWGWRGPLYVADVMDFACLVGKLLLKSQHNGVQEQDLLHITDL